jgi:hypothetical protein
MIQKILRVIFLCSLLLLLVTVNIVTRLPTFVTLVTEAIRSSETSVYYKRHMA